MDWEISKICHTKIFLTKHRDCPLSIAREYHCILLLILLVQGPVASSVRGGGGGEAEGDGGAGLLLAQALQGVVRQGQVGEEVGGRSTSCSGDGGICGGILS